MSDLLARLINAGMPADLIAEVAMEIARADVARRQEAERERALKEIIPWLTLRELAFARDGFACRYCGKLEGPFEIDHVIPRIKGGLNTLDNVVVSCRRCNRSKRDRKAPKL